MSRAEVMPRELLLFEKVRHGRLVFTDLRGLVRRRPPLAKSLREEVNPPDMPAGRQRSQRKLDLLDESHEGGAERWRTSFDLVSHSIKP